jgi:hypothetical protein
MTIDNLRKTVRSIVAAYTKLTPEWLKAYWEVFTAWIADNNIPARDPVTNRYPKGTEIGFFRFIFPEIPESRDSYRNNSLYTCLYRTVHPAAERLAGIQKHNNKGKGKKATDTAKAEPKADLSDINTFFKLPLVSAMLETIASFVGKDATKETRLLDYARSHQVGQSMLDVLAHKQAEYIKRVNLINQAKLEKKVS